MAAALTAPYCTSGHVYQLRLLMEDPSLRDFRPDGLIPDDVVDTWIGQIASQIDMAYASVGYVIPFEARTGEDWLSYQTTFLQYFNAVGVAAMTGGNAGSPRVTQFIQGERVGRTLYEDEWFRLIRSVREIGTRDATFTLVRANTRAGSAADRALSEPSPILTTYLEGWIDPAQFDSLRDYTLRQKYYAEDMNRLNPPTVGDPGTPEFMYLVHQRMGYTYEGT